MPICLHCIYLSTDKKNYMGIHEIHFYGGLLTLARHMGKLVENGKAYEKAQTEEEYKVHDDS